MINIDTIRKALKLGYSLAEWSHHKQCFNDALSALSIIDRTSDDEAVAKTLQYLNAGMDKKDAEIQRLTAHDDAIRQECAEKAVRSFLRCMAESDIATGNDYAVLVISDKIRAAILGTEPAREET